MDVYRDCFYGQADYDDPAYINIFDNANLATPPISLPIPFMGSDTIPVDVGDPCLFVPDDVCVEVARYRDTINLVSINSGFTIVYQRCCRNQSITNIIEPDQTGATYGIELSFTSMVQCNSSPVFGSYPPSFICVNRPIEYLHDAVDPDGDSLVYKLCTPLTGASFGVPQPSVAEPPPYDSVQWQSPYNLNNILGGSPALAIDPQTGLITGLPEVMGQFVVGICVEEYRNGILLSTTRRDFQYNVGECGEIVSTIEAPDVQCDNLTVEFGNSSTLAENYEWYFDWPNTDLFSTETEPTFTFPDTGTYTIALISEPGSSCVDTGYHEIFLQFNSITPDFDLTIFDCTDTSIVQIEDLSADNVSPLITWNWELNYGNNTLLSNLQNPVFQVPNPSSGTITLEVFSENGCVNSLTKSFETGGNNPDDQIANNVEICLGEAIGLNPTFAGNNDFTFQWAPPINPGNQVNPVVSPSQTTTYDVTIFGPNNLCSTETDVTVNVNALPQLAFDFDAECDGITVNFQNQSTNAPGYVWNFGDPNDPTAGSTSNNTSHTYPDIGTYNVMLAVDTAALCVDTLFQEITLAEKVLEADFFFRYAECSKEEIVILFQDVSVNTSGSPISWHWTFSDGAITTTTGPNPVATISNPLDLVVTLTITTEEGCVSTTTQTLDIEFIEYNFTDSVLVCPGESAELNPDGSPNYTYSWDPGIGLSGTNIPNPTVTPAQTTNYTLTITNFAADTCQVTEDVLVFVPPAIELNPGDNVWSCDAQTTLTATAAVPVDLTWFNGNNTPISNDPSITVDISGASNYSVEAVDQYGCQEDAEVSVVGGTVDIDLQSDNIICTDQNFNIQLVNNDPNDNLTLNWFPPEAFVGDPTNDFTPQINNTAGEQNILVVATSQYGCVATDSASYAIVDSNLSLGFDFVKECNGVVVNFENNSTNGYNYVWDFGDPNTTSDVIGTPGATPISYSYPAVGTYTVALTVGFDAECVDTLFQTVEIVEPQFIPDFTYEFLSCSEDEIVIQFNDASVNFLENTSEWFWNFVGVGISLDPNPIITVTQSQTLIVEFTIGTPNGCTGTITKTIEIELIDLPLEDEIILCPGESTGLNPNGNPNYEYQWLPTDYLDDPTSHNPTSSAPHSMVYTVLVTNYVADTCSVVGETSIFVPEQIIINAVNDTTTCGTSIALCAGTNISPIDFQWCNVSGNPIGVGNCIFVNPVDTATLIVKAKDQYQCEETHSVFVSNEQIDVSAEDVTVFCPIDTLDLSVLNNIPEHILNYQWIANFPGQIIGGANSETTTVITASAGNSASFDWQVVNQYNCTEEGNITLESHDFVPIFEDEVLACPDIPTAINPNANPAYSYAWSPPIGLDNSNAPNPNATILASQTYSVTISSDFGNDYCEEVHSTFVFVPEIIEINETVDTFTCGAPIFIGADVNIDPAIFVWTNEQNVQIGDDPNLEISPIDSATYYVEVTDQYGCSERDSVFVSNEKLDFQIEGDGFISICPLPELTACVTNLDPDDVLTYQWTHLSGDANIIDGADAPCIIVHTEPGTSNFEVLITNQYDCTITESLEILTHVFDALVEDSVRVCSGIPTSINQMANTDLDYLWIPGDCLNDDTAANPIITTADDKTFSVIITDMIGTNFCADTLEVHVAVNPLINLETNPTDSIILCETTDLTLSANGDTQVCYTWSQNPNFSNPINAPCEDEVTVTPNHTENYYVLAVDDLGCRDSSEIVVHSYEINTSLEDSYNFCREDGSIDLEVINHDLEQILTYCWSPVESTVNQDCTENPIAVNPSETTTYTVTIQNNFGCEIEDTTIVRFFDINASLDISAVPDTIILNSGEFSQLNVTDNPNWFYEWVPCDYLDDCNIPNPQAEPEEAGDHTYTVFVSNAEECAAERTVVVTVINPDCALPFVFIPSAFTPNGDGENDVFLVRGNNIESMELVIYNRWGQRMFETNDQNDSWDGTFKGELLSPAVFGYYLRATCYNGEEHFKKGNVSLLR